jgi:hypothetical protein
MTALHREGTVLVPALDGSLLCLSLCTGATQWAFTASGRLLAAAAPSPDGLVRAAGACFFVSCWCDTRVIGRALLYRGVLFSPCLFAIVL